jgi:ABC-type glycerol-3-phosphate transport system substrate-binding protein
MLKFYEKLLKTENKYMHPASNDVDFTNMQGMFLQGAAAMSPNGDWLENEMRLNYQNANIKYMKAPIISALANKLSFANASDKDAKLRTLVDYVDANASGYANKPDWENESDIDKVRDAHSFELTAGAGHNAFIPCYSTNKEVAKDFLRYLATDEAMGLYRSATGGCDLPFYWTNSPSSTGYSTFRQSVNQTMDRSELWVCSDKDKLYALGGLSSTHFFNNNNGRYVTCFSALSSKDYVSATEYYLAEQDWFQKNIVNIKKLAGLK